MKKTLWCIIFLIMLAGIVDAKEVAERITDREIIERLTRLEEGQSHILREMDKRFEAIDKRFEAMDKRFETIEQQII